MSKFVLVIFGLFLALTSCGGNGTAPIPGTPKEGEALHYADKIKITDFEEGWSLAEITNPWDTTRLLQRVVMVPRQLNIEGVDFPSDAVVVRTPLQRALVTSTVHINLLEEMGAEKSIAGVTDVEFIKSPGMIRRIENGEIADCGAWMSPNVERTIKLNPDAIIISPYENGGNYGSLTDLNIPVVYAADYMETHPLGRSEWVKYYARLFGVDSIGNKLYNNIETAYNAAKATADSVADAEGRPSVLLDLPYQAVWTVHGGGSSNDILIRDAGGKNPFAKIKDHSVGLPPEKVLMDAGNADIWLLRYYSPNDMDLQVLKSENPLYSRFKAFNNRNVWGCNTSRIPFFEETPFHPEILLGDLLGVLHPSVSQGPSRYFTRL